MKIVFRYSDINFQIKLLSILLPLALLLNFKYGLSSLSTLMMIIPIFYCLGYSILFFHQSGRIIQVEQRFIFIFIFLFFLFFFNFLVSEDRTKTLIKMISFFSYFGYSYIQFRVLGKKIRPATLAISTNLSLLILLVLGYQYLVVVSVVGQTVALYAGAGLLFCLYGQKTIKSKLLYSLLPLLMLLMSSSRGTFLIVCILIILASLFLFKSKRFWLGAIVLVLVSSFARVDTLIIDFFNAKTTAIYVDTQDSLNSSLVQREARITSGFIVFLENPILGVGVGVDLKDKMYKHIGVSQSPHNGYITTLIEGGLLLGGTIIIIVLTGALKIFNLKKDYLSDRYLMVNLFILFYLFRAIGENYLLFNFGNSVSIIFLFYIMNSLFKERAFK